MSDSSGTCEYVLDPDDPETWGGEEGDECYINREILNNEGLWTCSHETKNDEDFCPIHMPIDGKKDDKVIKFLLEKITDEENDSQEVRFIGGEFGTFDLTWDRPESEIEFGLIDFSHCKFNYFNISGGTGQAGPPRSGPIFDSADLILNGVEFENEAHFKNVIFKGDVYFIGSKFNGDTDFWNADFNSDAIFQNSQFGHRTRFNKADFNQRAEFSDALFREGRIDYFKEVNFKQNMNFRGVVFESESRFQVTVEGISKFSGASFRNNVEFNGSEFEQATYFQVVKFNDYADFSGAEFTGGVDFRKSIFTEDVKFENSKIITGPESQKVKEDEHIKRLKTFTGDNDPDSIIATFGAENTSDTVEFEGNVTFADSYIDSVDFRQVDLTDATFTGATLSTSNFESTLLSRATLFNADLRGTRLSGAVLGDMRIDDETDFLGHPSDDRNSSPHTLSAIRSQSTCVYDPAYEDDNEYEDVDKAKSVYRALEELGGKHARPRLQARSFVRRQDLQKQDYWDDATADDASLEERIIAGARWSRAKVARATLLYGESPWRVITWSLGIILSFALLYPLGGWMKPTDGDPITYAQIASSPVEILNSVYYSTLTYTALGFGDFQPRGLGRLLTTLETGLGAVMLALLVFILGRRAAR